MDVSNTMTCLQLIAKLKADGIELWLEQDELRFRARKEKLDPALRARIILRKEEIIRFLQEASQGNSKVLPGIERLANQKCATASYVQQRLWFMSNLDAGSYHYNILVAYKLHGRLDGKLLQSCFDKLVLRHDALHTRFADEAGVLMQMLDVAVDNVLELVELNDDLPEKRQKVVLETIKDIEKTVFNLQSGPLFKAILLKISNTEHVFVFCINHIIADAQSIDILLQELSAYYKTAQSVNKLITSPLSLQYIDYAVWQKKLLENNYFHEQVQYWQQELSGELPILEFPFDHPRPAIQRYIGNVLRTTADNDAQGKIKKLLTSHDKSTFFTVLLSAYFAALYRYTGQSTLIVGIPIANRPRVELENVVGMFVNSVAIRVDITPNMSFTDLLQMINQKMLAAHANQDLPFEKIVDMLDLQRNLSHSPIFQTMFFIEEQSANSFVLEGIAVEKMQVPTLTSKFDLSLAVQNSADQLMFNFEYNTDLLDTTTIERFSRHFNKLLIAVLDKPTLLLRDIPLLTEDETRQLIYGFNNTAKPFRRNIRVHELFEEQVEKTPDAIAVVYQTQTITYRDLNHQANQLAHYLIEKGITADCCVAVFMERSIEVVVALLAILKAGGTFVPLDAESPSARIEYTLNDSEAKIIISQSHLISRLPDFQNEIIDLALYRAKLAEYSVNNLFALGDMQDLAYVIYTSGSTGKPKGVMIHHEGFAHYILWALDYYKCSEGCGAPAHSSLAFDLTITTIFAPICCGKTVFMTPDELGVEGLLNALEERQDYSIIKITPAHLKLLQEVFSVDILKKLHAAIVIGGEALYETDLAFWRKHSPQMHFINEYGATETSVACTIYEVKNTLPDTISIPVGKAIANSQMYVLDDQLQPQPIGVVGEIYLGGLQLARGYLKRADLTADRFIDNPFPNTLGAKIYKTGDLGKVLADGNVEFVGRIDNQVKLKGYRIELGEIEKCLENAAQIKQAVVVVREDAQQTKQLVAYIVTKASMIDLAEIQEFLRAQLPAYMLPSAYVLLDVIPLTINGKVDVSLLPEPIIDNIKATNADAEPVTANEKILKDIWVKVLRTDKIGIHDNFFALGGDSIVSLQIIVEARKLDLLLKPKQIFQYQTIAELAKVMSAQIHQQIEREVLTGDVPLLPIQQWFLQQNVPAISHWNQAFILQCQKKIDAAILEKALAILVQQHDVLALRFTNENGTWRQFYDQQEIKQQLLLSVYDSDDTLVNLEDAKNACQQALDIGQGKLLHGLLIRGQEADQLLLAIHHLVVDGVSWRILLQDLNHIYSELLAGKDLVLPQKTTSFFYWTKKITQKVKSGTFDKDIAYWSMQVDDNFTKIPVDIGNGKNTETSAKTVVVKLSLQETSALLQKANKSYKTQINELLLSALTQALGKWSSQEKIIIDLEGHGREDLFDEVDLSHTVGWFTSAFPVMLDTHAVQYDIKSSILKLKSQLRNIPQKGIGYGLLRYCHPDKSTRTALENNSRISFNYLGQFNNNRTEDAIFNLSALPVGNVSGFENIRPYLININGIVIDGCLQFEFIYSANIHHEDNVNNLAQYYWKGLQAVITHCMAQTETVLTPEDFPLAGLDQKDLDGVLLQWPSENIEDIYPVSPMQAGMLFHSLYAVDPAEYVCQMCWDIPVTINPKKLQGAWQVLVGQHAIFRTVFCWEKVSEVQQVVLRNIELPWYEHDWQSLSLDMQNSKLENLLSSDKKTGFAFHQAPLMRVNLIKLNDGHYKMLWTFHHILLDGWSVARIMNELKACYTSNLVSYSKPYQHYIAWLRQQDKDGANAYWRSQFKDFTLMPPLGNALNSSENNIINYQESIFQINKTITSSIHEFCQQHGVTVNTFLQGAWALLLKNYCQSNDVVFGITVSGRPVALDGVESIIGNFINTLPLRVTLGDNENVIDYLRRIQLLNLDMQQYEFSQLAEIKRQLKLSAKQELFETLVVYENYPKAIVDDNDVALPLENLVADEHSNYPLTLIIAPQEQLLFKLSYQTQRFDAAQIEQLYNNYCSIIAWMLTPHATSLAACHIRNPVPTSNVAIEQKLAEIWCNILHCAEPKSADSFFALGGQSLSAIRALSKIRDAFQIDMNLRDFFAKATLAEMAEFIASKMMNKKNIDIEDYVFDDIPANDYLPLSFAQERLWFHEQLEPNSKTYNVPFVQMLEGELDIAYLQQTINILIARHSILRTTFHNYHGDAIQRIHAELKCELRFEEYSEGKIEQEITQPFNLEAGPLIRILILKVSTNKNILCITQHHIITDAWSLGLFLKELMISYAALVNNKLPQFPMPVMQYKDYAVWQRGWVKNNKHRQQLDYWQKELSNVPHHINLVDSNAVFDDLIGEGALYQFAIKSEIRDAVLELAARMRITSSTVLLTNYQLLLHGYTQQQRFVTGIAVANRSNPAMENLMGFLVNTLPIVANIVPSMNVSELLQQVHASNIAAIENQDVPFDLLVNALAVERKLGVPPLVQAMFSFQNAAALDFQLDGIKSRAIDFDLQIAKFFITLSLHDNGAHFVGGFEYNKNLFSQDKIAEMANLFAEQLELLIKNPHLTINEIVNNNITKKLSGNNLQQKLVAIWRDVLKVDIDNANLNFFRLGGNSIAMIKVITKAKEQGITFSVRQFLKHQTISALTKEIESVYE